MKIKKYISTFIAMALVSCAPNVPNTQINKVSSSNEKINVVSQLQEVNINGVVRQDTNFLTVSEKGADLKLNVVFSDPNNYKIKANVDGVAEKKLTDVAKVDVYLMQLASAPAAGSDPLGVANANVVKSFTNVAKTDSGAGFSLLLKGVPANTTGNTYFVGVVVKDSANNIINKPPAVAWTGNTLTTAANMRVTSTGVSVDNALVVSTTTALTISLPLLDAIGAKINTAVGITNGGTGSGTISNAFSYNADAFVIAGGNAILASESNLNSPQGIAVDSSGNVYIADTSNNIIEKVDTAGNIKVIAGNSTATVKASYGTQNATAVSLNSPQGIAVDSSGNVYIADRLNNLVEKIDTAGKIIAIAGNSTNSGVKASYGTQNASAVSLFSPTGVAVDSAGNVYIADAGNNLVEKVDTSGKIIAIAGNSTNSGVKASYGTQNASAVSFSSPTGVAVDSAGNVYIADRSNNLIEKVDTSGKIIAIAGNSTTSGVKASYGTQNASAVSLFAPSGVAVDSSGNIYIVDQVNYLIEKVDTAGKIIAIAGNSTTSGVKASYGTQNASAVSLNTPTGVAVDSSGNVYIADTSNNIIEKVDTASAIIAIAGGGTIKTIGTQNATNVKINAPAGVAVDSTGNVYIADTTNNLIEKVDTATGKIKVIAGGGTATSGTLPDTSGTQNATDIKLTAPSGVALDSTGNIYIADTTNRLIEKVDTATGKIKVLAGGSISGTANTSGTQNATDIRLNVPAGVALDSSGNVYIAETTNRLIEKVDTATGKIKVLAGGSISGTVTNTSGTQNATDIRLNAPAGVALDTTGNIYIADTNNNLIEKVDTATGKIKVIAGGTTTFPLANTSGTQNATDIRLIAPSGVSLDSTGNIYIADTNNRLIEKIDTATGKIKVISGISTSGTNNASITITKKATSITLNGPKGVAIDSAGNIYIADTGSSQIVKVTGL